jgi:GH15 family glucan-1,4-alpha-glucosidase
MSAAADVWEAPAIGDYAFLSDCSSAALVDRRCSVDWWCVPRFDSPSVFGRLLDPSAGHWSLHPSADFTSSRRYLGDTLVLHTVFRTNSGEVSVTDALAMAPGTRGHELGVLSPHILLRQVEGLSGEVELDTELSPRMEYGRTEPYLRADGAGVEARGGPVRLRCTGPVTWRCDGGTARAALVVSAGERVDLRLAYTPTFASTPPAARPDVEPTVDDTAAAWASWAAQHTDYDGSFPNQVRRSSIVLQGLTYRASGAVVAAATTSLPEELGGTLNFDYRFAWLRDLSLTIRSLWIAACPDEPGQLFDWFANAAGHNAGELVQIMYGVEGERDLSEHELEHLSGYRGSKPVRVGNQAWKQTQLDVLGEVLDAAAILSDSLGTLEPAVQDMLVTMADRAAADWPQPDAGMWEARDADRHYTTSKVMCWVALDRAVRLAPSLGDRADPDRWATARDDVHATVLERAWNPRVGAYTGAFGSEQLDASVLLLPLVNFLPADDPLMWATIEAIERKLTSRGLVRRWDSDTSGFLICTYWLAECLAMGGRIDRAEAWFSRASRHANDLGLLSEEADPVSGELLGNMPQAFSHVGLINAAWRIGQAQEHSKTRTGHD